MQKIADLFPVLPEELRQKRLEWPHGKINAVLDTDLSNEIDDLFALGLAILTPEKINLQAVTATKNKINAIKVGKIKIGKYFFIGLFTIFFFINKLQKISKKAA